MPSTTPARARAARSATALLTGCAVAAGVITSAGLLYAGHPFVGFALAALTFTAYSFGTQLDAAPADEQPVEQPSALAQLAIVPAEPAIATAPLDRIGAHRHTGKLRPITVASLDDVVGPASGRRTGGAR